MKKILVPCDFSEAAKHAFKFAVEIAASNDGEVIVANMIEPPVLYGDGMPCQPHTYMDLDFDVAKSIKEAKKDFDNLKQSIAINYPRLTFLVETGPVKEMILQIIEQQKVDLVVMGTSGASGFKEIFIGSNTEKIVRAAPVPVFTVHGATRIYMVRNIIFPTTMDLNESDLTDKIKSLQNFFQAKLHILHINYPGTLITDQNLKNSLENYALVHDFTNYTLHVRTDISIQDGIVKFASKFENSIIAMATNGKKGIFHLLMGSTAEDVVNHVHQPVWTYRVHQH